MQLKDFVEIQMNAISDAFEQSGQVDIIKGKRLVNSVSLTKQEVLGFLAENVDEVIFSYGVFSFPNFSEVAAKNINKPIMLAANLNPDWLGIVAMLASGGALHHLGIDHFRIAGD